MKRTTIICLRIFCAIAFVVNIASCSKPSTELVEITVTFDSNGGIPASTEVTVNSGATVTPPKTPTKSRNVFKHWYIGNDANVPFDFSIPINDPKQRRTLCSCISLATL